MGVKRGLSLQEKSKHWSVWIKVMNKIFWFRSDEVTKEWRNMHNKELFIYHYYNEFKNDEIGMKYSMHVEMCTKFC